MKKTMTEQEAIGRFMLEILQGIQGNWQAIYSSLRELFGPDFVLEDEPMAMFDFALATIALNIRPIQNLFQKTQAERLKNKIIEHLRQMNKDSMEGYALEEVIAYEKALEINPVRIKLGENPLDGISTRLLSRWLGEGIEKHEVVLGGKKTGYISPLLLMAVAEKLVGFLGFWKAVRENFDLIEEPPPLNMDSLGLKDFSEESDANNSEGTIQYYDAQGNLCSKRIHPEELQKMLKIGAAKRVYKVLIKGPWDGIKEAYWELSDENVKTFVDEKSYAYAICANENGEPKYLLSKKNIWENMEKVEEIMMDSSLSETERAEAIQKLGEE